MKGILESAEAFEAHATISAGYFMLAKLQKQIDGETAKLPIHIMIERATGVDKIKLDRHKKDIAICLLDIIEAKKVIEADYSNDEKFLAQLTA